MYRMRQNQLRWEAKEGVCTCRQNPLMFWVKYSSHLTACTWIFEALKISRRLLYNLLAVHLLDYLYEFLFLLKTYDLRLSLKNCKLSVVMQYIKYNWKHVNIIVIVNTTSQYCYVLVSWLLQIRSCYVNINKICLVR